jgi:hypothetical protein
MSQRVRAAKLEEITFNTPEGPLTVAVLLLVDGRIGIYEWDEEHGYFPLVGPYKPETPPKPRRRRWVDPRHSAYPEWQRWTWRLYRLFAARVNEHPARHRELPPEPPSPVVPAKKAPRTRAIRCPYCKAKGIRSFEDLTPADQCWYGDFVPEVIVNAPGVHLVADRYDFGDQRQGLLMVCSWTRSRQGRLSGSSTR